MARGALQPPATESLDGVTGRPAGRRRASTLAGSLSMLLLGLILLGRLGLGAAYSLVQPPLESHDETGHSAYVAWIASHLALPPPGNVTTHYFDEGHQPPLYYVPPGVVGHVLGWTDTYQPPMNPFFLSADGSRGVNAAVHVPSAEAWPWSPAVALLHLARFWSVLLGAIAVWLTWLAGRLALPERPGVALAGAAIAAFVPTSLAVTDAVTNDALVPVTFGFALVAALLFLRAPSAGRAALLGLAVGLSLLTKNSALVLVPFALLVVAVNPHPQPPLPEGEGARRRAILGLPSPSGRGVGVRVSRLAVLCMTILVVAGWWYLRNRLLYGHWITDRIETSAFITAPGVQGKSVLASASGGFVAQLADYTFRSFWVLMGWGTIGAPERVYQVLLVFTVVCLAGLVWLAVRARGLRRARGPAPTGTADQALKEGEQRTTNGDTAARRLSLADAGRARGPAPTRLGPVVLAVFFLLMLPEPLYRAVYYEAPTLVPGRYLFGGLGAAALLLALGWSALFGRARAVLALPGLGLAVISLWLLPNVVQPAYAAPAPLPVGTVIPNPVDVVYGGQMHLIGYAVTPESVPPGGTLRIVLYWQATRPMTQAYTVGVHVVDKDGNSLGEVDSFPGRGNLGTPLWRPGQTYADPYDVPVNSNAAAPQLGRLYVGVQLLTLDPQPNDPTHRRTGEVLTPTSSAGQAVTPIFGRFRIGSPVPPDQAPLRDRFGSDLGLEAVTLPAQTTAGQTLNVQLRLRSLHAPLPHLVVFAHLLRADGTFAAGTDAEPLAGRYPTDLWLAGEAVDDTIAIPVPATLPPGRYGVEAGAYALPASGQASPQRLPVTDASGQALPDGRVIAGEVVVAAR